MGEGPQMRVGLLSARRRQYPSASALLLGQCAQGMINANAMTKKEGEPRPPKTVFTCKNGIARAEMGFPLLHYERCLRAAC